jgi:hypothetical protein
MRFVVAIRIEPPEANRLAQACGHDQLIGKECVSTPSRYNPARAQTINGGAFRCDVLPDRRKKRPLGFRARECRSRAACGQQNRELGA